jgi:hypothetical protein
MVSFSGARGRGLPTAAPSTAGAAVPPPSVTPPWSDRSADDADATGRAGRIDCDLASGTSVRSGAPRGVVTVDIDLESIPPAILLTTGQ